MKEGDCVRRAASDAARALTRCSGARHHRQQDRSGTQPHRAAQGLRRRRRQCALVLHAALQEAEEYAKSVGAQHFSTSAKLNKVLRRAPPACVAPHRRGRRGWRSCSSA